MSHLMPTLSEDVSRILLFLKAIRYGRHEEILSEFLLTVKKLSFAPGGPGLTLMPINRRLLYGLLLRLVCRPCVRYGETDDLAREAADGTRHACQVISGPVTKGDIARAATDPSALVFDV